MVGVARTAVVGGRTDTTVQHNVGGHARAVILEGREARTRHARTGVRDALDALQRLQIQAVVVVVGHDQVRLIRTTDQLNRNRVHVLLDVGSRHRRATIGDTAVRHRTPERPRCAVDAAVGSGGRAVGNRRREAGEVLARVARAVAVQVTADAVRQLRFGHFHTTIKKVNDRFLARVLDHFQTRDGHSRGVLRNAELRGRDRAVLTDVQHFVTRVRVGVVGGRVVVHDFLQNHVTAGERLDVPTVL